MGTGRKTVLPLLFLFIFLSALFISSTAFFEKHDIDKDVLIIANIILFVCNLASILLLQRSLKNSNPNAFVRAMMGSTIIKLLVIAISFAAYAFAVKRNINKPAVYISIFLYFIYLGIEVAIVLKLNKQKNA